MGRSEARRRLRELYEVVRYNDIDHWGQEFLQAVAQAQRQRRAQLIDSTRAA